MIEVVGLMRPFHSHSSTNDRRSRLHNW